MNFKVSFRNASRMHATFTSNPLHLVHCDVLWDERQKKHQKQVRRMRENVREQKLFSRI